MGREQGQGRHTPSKDGDAGGGGGSTGRQKLKIEGQYHNTNNTNNDCNNTLDMNSNHSYYDNTNNITNESLQQFDSDMRRRSTRLKLFEKSITSPELTPIAHSQVCADVICE